MEKLKKTINEIKLEFLKADEKQMDDLLQFYSKDTRNGVKKIIEKYHKEKIRLKEEVQRIKNMKSYEEKYYDYSYICGIDEVGRGPLAGPVMACGVILPKDCDILYLNDSKKLTEKMRESLYDEIMKKAVSVGIGSSHGKRIDEINILQATYEAMRQAIESLSIKPDLLLNDAVTIPEVSTKQVPIIKGDSKSISIAAASIIAKVTRDRLMVAYDSVFPQYGFAKNKGYGSKEHIEAIRKYGPCPLHRMSFIQKFI